MSVASGGNNIENVIDGILYFWQHSPDNSSHVLSEYKGVYATLTLVGATTPEIPAGISGPGTSAKVPYQYIPVGQGFFVNGLDTNTGTRQIVFNNNQRAFIKEDAIDELLVPISNTLFKQKSQKADHFNDNSNDVVYNDYVTKIRLGFNAANMLHRQLLLGFMNENATDGLDLGYDGYQIDTKANDMYFLIDEFEYTIQGVGAFNTDKSYDLGVAVDVAGNVQFMIDEVEFLPANQIVYIHDKETSSYYDITNKSVEINLAAGTYNNRFALTFKTEMSLSIKESEVSESIVLIYNNKLKNQLNITKNQEVTINEVSVYNIIGQLMSNVKEVANLNTIEVPFNVQKGVYIVKINTDKGTISKKVLKH
jgi:hypothetical protein